MKSWSWAAAVSRAAASAGMTPTPQIAQPRCPAASNRSTYIASCARWKAPTPMWTMPHTRVEPSTR
ncbi:hypothetical protein QE449_004216 [Rhodococcus sp. SORGH_AS303]|nr:hypothetical protein [Rhodococcus sp. SORGH_AS_0303]MDQ1203598.1 hypothetical protein [Rhodococcus sp. SORGH_AS_0303]